jgi:hypothetical protein
MITPIMSACTSAAILSCVNTFCSSKAFHPEIEDYNITLVSLDTSMKLACNAKYVNPVYMRIFPYTPPSSRGDSSPAKLYLNDANDTSLYVTNFTSIQQLTSILNSVIFTVTVDTGELQRIEQAKWDSETLQQNVETEYTNRRNIILTILSDRVKEQLLVCLTADPTQREWFKKNGKLDTFTRDTQQKVTETTASYLSEWKA